jgi:hypothetical protein
MVTSTTDNPSAWRLTTVGGVKYRFLGMDGSFDPEGGEISWRGLFQAADLLTVLVELFPPPLELGNVTIPTGGFMPGIPNFIAKKVGFKTQEGVDLPIDPFAADVGAALGTYHGLIELDITFGPSNKREPDPNDPRTFLEIKSKTGGEFIYISPDQNTKLQPETNNLGSADEDPSDPTLDPDTARRLGMVTGETKIANRNPIIPTVIFVPKTEWTITWKQIPYEHFRNTVVWRLRIMNGRVNSKEIPFMFDAEPETLLFAGFDYGESYTWRDGKVNVPPIDVTFKLIEKRLIWNGVTIGHNHSFDPKRGWVRVWLGANSDERPYRLWDMNFLFKP